MAVLTTSYEVESGFYTTLKNSISKTQTTGIIINVVPTITKGVLNFDANNTREEWVGFGSITDNGDGTATLGDVTRGLPLTGETFTGSSTRSFPHSGGVCKVTLVDYHALFNLKANKDRANTFTADNTFTNDVDFSGASATFRLPNHSTASRDLLVAPANGMKIYNTTTGEEQIYNAGTWYTLATGSTQPNATTVAAGKVELPTQAENDNGDPTGGTGAGLASTPALNAVSVQNSAWTYKLTTGSANAYVLTITPAVTAYVTGQIFVFKASFANTGAATINLNGLGAITIKKNYDQSLNSGDIKSGQIVTIGYDGTNFQMLSVTGSITNGVTGTAGATTADKDMLTYYGDQRLVLADANDAGLNTEWLFAGIATGASTSGNLQGYVPTGPVVDVTAFTLSDRLNCRLWDYSVSNTTQNTATDAMNASTEWRAQTFTASSNTGEDNIGGVRLYLTKTGAPTGNCTVSIRATSAGLPTGADLATSVVAYSTITTGVITFTLSTAVALVAGTVYAIVFQPGAGVSGGAYCAWNYQSSSVYANGTSVTSADSGTNWTAESSFDRYFAPTYRGIAGEPVYLSDTAGALVLTPGAYISQVGYALSTTQMVLRQPKRQIYATYTYNSATAGETVDTEITVGFRATRITAISGIISPTSGSSNSAGTYIGGSSGAARCWYNTGGFSGSWNSTAYHDVSLLRMSCLTSSAAYAPSFTVQAVSGSTVTIRRTYVAHGSGGIQTIVYLVIEE